MPEARPDSLTARRVSEGPDVRESGGAFVGRQKSLLILVQGRAAPRPCPEHRRHDRYGREDP